MNFKELHEKKSPLLLGNVWSAHSAKIAQDAGYEALGTSSHAIAFELGYEDGEKISFEELFFIVKRIVKSVNIPVSVDFEAGYSSDPKTVAKHVKQLAEIGVQGINIEDGIVQDGSRILGSEDILVEKIKAIRDTTDLFINARIDTYTTKHEDALTEALRRAELYKNAGADGLFVPLIEKEEDIKTFVSETNIPLNVFTTPNLPSFEILSYLGVKRISHGAKQYDLLMKKSKGIFEEFLARKDYKLVLA